jgi:hypothetical protein
MATLTQKVCDRCGQPMEYNGWTGLLKNVFKSGKSIKILKLYNGNPSGYDYSVSCYELCADCIRKLENFLMNEEDKKL